MLALARVFPQSRLLEDGGGNDEKKGALARRALLVKGALSFSRNSQSQKQKTPKKQKTQQPAVVLTLSSDSRRLLWQFVLWLLTDGEFQACMTDPIGYIRSVRDELRFG
jgi:hypothetical protein